MARMRKKSELPEKSCAGCGRPFVWRRKWASVWDQVRYCSNKCRKLKKTRVPSEKFESHSPDLVK